MTVIPLHSKAVAARNAFRAAWRDNGNYPVPENWQEVIDTWLHYRVGVDALIELCSIVEQEARRVDNAKFAWYYLCELVQGHIETERWVQL